MATDDRCRPPVELAEPLEDEPVVLATPTQVLTGHQVGPRADAAICIGCGDPLHETDIVFAYAYRCAEAADWAVSRLYCFSCAPKTIKSPTLGTTEVVMGGRLGTIALPTLRTHRLCLTELKIRAVSPPTEGCPP
ncbi:hypothetical protein OB955_22085 [Halobacteria archaeon AArc-m2/3/4]|uniref:DUF8112 domain-containing protein n=1 Tax=Natronoglomus mannanivorans TaxID=2979990 RepID=A0ABT2QKD2_9EURY|nr:hypothetical protein [Halobacteria archaeon AArc-m2/3/4]